MSDLEKLFPLKCSITQEMIDNEKSLGTRLLKDNLPEELHEHIFWGLSIGNVKDVKIKTEIEMLHMGKKIMVPLYLDSSIRQPCDVIFTIRK